MVNGTSEGNGARAAGGVQIVPVAGPDPVTQIAPLPVPDFPGSQTPADDLPAPEPIAAESVAAEPIAAESVAVESVAAESVAAVGAGLPRRAPRPASLDEEDLKQAFLRSWEAPATEPAIPATPGFVPTYPSAPTIRLTRDDPAEPKPASPEPTDPEPGSPQPTKPQPAEPRPEPVEPQPVEPQPAEPPQPIRPRPAPPVPTPSPVPVPAPVPPTPKPVPPLPSPVPPAPGPMPTPPPAVPPPPVIRARPTVPSASSEGPATDRPAGLAIATRPGSGRVASAASGSLSGHLRVREEASERRRARKARARKVLWTVIGLAIFLGAITFTAYALAYDFLMSIFHTFSEFAG